MGRAEHRLLGRLGHDFGRRQLKVIMRVFKVADGIFTFCDVDGFVRHHLDVLAVKYSVILLCDHIRDPGLAGVEVVADLLHVECLAALCHLRLAFPLLRQTVVGASGKDRSCRHVVFHVIRLELNILIGDLHVTPIVHFSLPIGEILAYRVLRARECRP